jgi:hypothetical protein
VHANRKANKGVAGIEVKVWLKKKTSTGANLSDRFNPSCSLTKIASFADP